MTLTSRKTQQEVRLRLDRLDYELLKREIRDAVREELEAHERRTAPVPEPKYVGGYVYQQAVICACGRYQKCPGYSSSCGLAPR